MGRESVLSANDDVYFDPSAVDTTPDLSNLPKALALYEFHSGTRRSLLRDKMVQMVK